MSGTSEVRVRQSDALTWNMEKDPLLRSTIVAVMVFDRAPDWALLVDRTERATRIAPTFRQRLVPSPFKLAPPRFQFDPDFDLSWHLRRVSAPAPHTLATVLDIARCAGMAAFDPARPLWECTLVDGLADGRAAIVLKVHHSLTDGIGGIQVAAHILDLAPEPADLGPMPEPPTRSDGPFRALGAGPLGGAFDALGWDLTRAGGAALRRLAEAPRDVLRAARDPISAVSGAVDDALSFARFLRPVTRTQSPIMTGRRLSWHFDVLEVGTADLKRAGNAAGGSLNDAFLAGVTGGLRCYHEALGAPVDKLCLSMPISLRAPNDPEGGNRLTLMRFDVPVGTEDPMRRMIETGNICKRQRRESAVSHTETLAGLLNLLPSAFLGGMLKHVDFLASNVPGLSDPVWLAGARLEAFYPFGPTLGSSANITLMSFLGTCCIGVNVDTAAVPDPAFFLDCLAAGFNEVLDVAGDHGGVRLALHDEAEHDEAEHDETASPGPAESRVPDRDSGPDDGDEQAP